MLCPFAFAFALSFLLLLLLVLLLLLLFHLLVLLILLHENALIALIITLNHRRLACHLILLKLIIGACVGSLRTSLFHWLLFIHLGRFPSHQEPGREHHEDTVKKKMFSVFIEAKNVPLGAPLSELNYE